MRTYAIFKDKKDRSFYLARKTWFGWFTPIMDDSGSPCPLKFDTKKEAKKWLKRNRTSYTLKKGIGVVPVGNYSYVP